MMSIHHAIMPSCIWRLPLCITYGHSNELPCIMQSCDGFHHASRVMCIWRLPLCITYGHSIELPCIMQSCDGFHHASRVMCTWWLLSCIYAGRVWVGIMWSWKKQPGCGNSHSEAACEDHGNKHHQVTLSCIYTTSYGVALIPSLSLQITLQGNEASAYSPSLIPSASEHSLWVPL